MSLVYIKNERKVLDSLVVLAPSVSAYLIGYLQVLELGAITATVTLPNVFLVGLAFLHLVVRKGRKFDRKEHKLSYEGLKTLVFGGIVYTSFQAGLSTTKNTFMPQDLSTAFLALLFVASGLYLMAYRANR